MRRALTIMPIVLLLAGCGGGTFDIEHPPSWLTRLGNAMPKNPLRAHELEGCTNVALTTPCTATVARSSRLVRNAFVRLADGQEAQLTYVPPGGSGVAITVTPDGGPARVPVRRSGGSLEFVCTKAGMHGCVFELVEAP
jgi:hypothetical protein